MGIPDAASQGARRFRTTASICIALVLLAGACYIAASVAATPDAVLIAQIDFCLVPAASAIAAALAARSAERSSRERRMWLLLALMLGLLACGEIAYSTFQLAYSAAGPSGGWVSDVFFVSAGVTTFILLLFLGGFDLLPLPTRVRLTADSIVLLSLGAALGFSVWTLFGSQRVPMPTEVRLAAAVYVVCGLVSLGVASMLVLEASWSKPPNWVYVLAAGSAIYSAALFVWPAWRVASLTRSNPLIDLGVEALLLVGYGVVGTAAAGRLASGQPWEPLPTHAPFEGRYGWPSIVVASASFGAMVVLGLLAWLAPTGSAVEDVAMSALVVAGVGLLIATTSAGFENRVEGDRALKDPVTGLANMRGYDDALGRIVGDARMSGRPVSLILVDLDDFARVNDSQGYVAADRYLAEAGERLLAHAGSDATVARTGGDDFAIVLPSTAKDEASETGRRILRGVRCIATDAGPLTASVGVATYPDDAGDVPALRRAAVAALAWAKCHGKNRTVTASPTIARSDEEAVRSAIAETGLRLDLARGLAAAVDARDYGNPYHGRNVSALASFVAEQLGFEQRRIAQVEVAGLLHDVGTLALPDSVLESPGRAASIQRREHAALGERFCRSIGFEDIAGWVRAHHEHWDGTGYPDSLNGDEIPLEARLLALCDAYDNLTGGRRGRGGLSKSAALQEIDQGIASRFDPGLTERFIAIIGAHDSLGWYDVREAT